jgi:ribosomal protein L13
MDFGLHRCQTDHSVFHLHTVVGYIIPIVNVDDIVITGSDYGGIIVLKQRLQQRFHTKDFGEL